MSRGKRVQFSEGEQKKFLKKAKEQMCFDNWREFAEEIDVHRRTLIDWKEEKYTIPLVVLRKICEILDREIPSSVEVKEPFWHTHKAGKKGGFATYKKYGRVGGDPEYRKKKWREWWESEGKDKVNLDGVVNPPKPIERPELSEELAEFAGIMIGDGGITDSQTTISLNSRRDKQYSTFINNLIEELFGVEPSVYFREDTSEMYIVVSRTLLVEFCVSIGLNKGDKLAQGLDIPKWIREKTEFETSCLRGIMDTDGCVFNECHNVEGRKYCYTKTAIVSESEPLLETMFEIMENLDFSPRIRNQRSVKLEKEDEVERYFDLVNTHNPKHRRRFEKLRRESERS